VHCSPEVARIILSGEILFPSLDRQLVSRLQDEIASLVNDITDLLVSCGFCSPFDIIELYGEQIPSTIAKKPKLNPDQISFEAVFQGCKFIHYLLSKYWMDIKYVILDHHQCFCHMKDFLSEALQRSESEAFIKTKLTQVKSRFMLPLICAAAEHNLWFLQFSENPEQLELGARLAKDLFRWFKSTALYNSLGFSLTMVPIFFMDLHDPIRKISNAVDPFDLKKVSNLVAAAFLQESRTEDAFNILERVVDHLISELRRTFTARETVELIRQVFRTAPMIIPDRKKAAFELRLETKLTTFLSPFLLAPMPLPLRRPAGPGRRPPSRAPREIGF
jgi:hypothetical protein